jgi:diguanylate cyclase (GGDEF)-like protein
VLASIVSESVETRLLSQVRSSAFGGTGTAAIDPATERAIARYRFPEELEKAFQSHYLEHSLPRARWATAIYLALVAVVTAINMRGGMASGGETLLQPIYLLRLGIACPALVLILAATVTPSLQSRYQWVTSIAVIVTAMSVMGISALAAVSGMPQFQMGDVLVVVYATLFLGLLARPVIVVAAALMIGFVGIGWLLGVSSDHLIFASAVMLASTLMCVLSALRVERLARAGFVETQLLNDFAERDGLSGLYNRRMFDSLANRLWLQAKRNLEPLQVILVDIDHFKSYNDLYGHQAGDACIRQVANIIARAARRPFDFCARYGGEEFALVLYAPSGGDASAIPEQIRRETMALDIPHAHASGAGMVTVSIGSAIAEPGSKRSLAGLIQTADEALYRAKQLGRNRALHVDAGQAETPTGAFKVFALK